MLYTNYEFVPVLVSTKEFYSNITEHKIFSEELGLWCPYEIDDEDMKIYVIVLGTLEHKTPKFIECIEMYLTNNNISSRYYAMDALNDF